MPETSISTQRTDAPTMKERLLSILILFPMLLLINGLMSFFIPFFRSSIGEKVLQSGFLAVFFVWVHPPFARSYSILTNKYFSKKISS